MADQNKGAQKPAGEKPGFQKTVIYYVHDLAYMLVGVVLVFLVVFRIIVVTGDSMYDTLWDGDFLLLLSNTFYREPRAGDIVVISKKSFEDGKPIVKRIIATEGQTVDIDFEAGEVYVDGAALEEPYITVPTTVREGTVFPLTVAEGCIFVMGDNRGVSKDSRSPDIGQIDEREVLGKAVLLFLPGTHHDLLPREMSRGGWIR